MGIINVTPDSFSDGGSFLDLPHAVDHALRLIDDGADIIDIGGVATSTYARAMSVSEDEELARVLPVIEALSKRCIKNISLDTSRSNVARRALMAGASWINDQSGLADEEMPLAMTKADGVVIMHNNAGTMSGVVAGESQHYHDVVSNLCDFFSERVERLVKAGVRRENIVTDPGIGFGKGVLDSLRIINAMHRFGDRTLIGVSRKSLIGKLSGIEDPSRRDVASLGATAVAIFSGANIIRTHNVRATKEFVQVLDHCRAGRMHEDLHEARR